MRDKLNVAQERLDLKLWKSFELSELVTMIPACS